MPEKRWNYETAAHLLGRAGFGGTPVEIEELAGLGLEGAVSHLVDFDPKADAGSPEWAKPDFERAERMKAARTASPEERRRLIREEQQSQRRRIVELRAWWLERMASGVRPLQEKMTLFWHGHFATSFEKVRDAYLMWRQNDVFRRWGLGSWLQLLTDVSQDPAMLIWLDQAQSRKQHPNENFARELMELFTLGEGHYSEQDVTEAARALTGWSYNRISQEFAVRPVLHDTGEKMVLGRTGNLDGYDLLKLILAQPQADRFITSKLWRFFAGAEPAEDLQSRLAAVFRSADQEFKPLLRAMFLSEEFYGANVVGNQVKSPVEWLVGSVRLLERPLPPPEAASSLIRFLGQDLFAPPNVKGWDGGLSWINTNSLLTRYNQSATLVYGGVPRFRFLAGKGTQRVAQSLAAPKAAKATVNLERLFSEHDRSTPDQLIRAIAKRFLHAPLSSPQQTALRDHLKQHSELTDEVLLEAVCLVMCTPEYQLV